MYRETLAENAKSISAKNIIAAPINLANGLYNAITRSQTSLPQTHRFSRLHFLRSADARVFISISIIIIIITAQEENNSL